MKPLPSEPSDPVALLRQQLILAQVRIMELEDSRDSLVPRLTELEQLLQLAQSLADQKINETVHLEKILAELRAHCDQLLQNQRLSNQVATTKRPSETESLAKATKHDETISRLESSLKELDRELRTVKSSRCWRWTAWLRELGGRS